MKKVFFIFVVCLSLFLCGCKQEQSSGYSFTDDLGREVCVSSSENVATLLGSFADLWILAGGEVCAAADDAWEDFSLDLPAATVNLGGTENLSLEKLLYAKPDFVIASTKRKQHIEWKETLENAGICVAYFDISDFDDYLRVLKICTDITGRADLYLKNGVELKEQIDEIVKNKFDCSYLLLRASPTYIRAKKSGGTVLGEMLSDFGCTNIADSDDGLLENLSIESIIEKNPDYIFVVQAGDDVQGTKIAIEDLFNENPAWKELSAVKKNNVFFMDKKLFNFKPNARWGEAYVKLYKILEK